LPSSKKRSSSIPTSGIPSLTQLFSETCCSFSLRHSLVLVESITDVIAGNNKFVMSMALILPVRSGTRCTFVRVSRYTAMNSGETNLGNQKVF
jgi:hypothetical protein